MFSPTNDSTSTKLSCFNRQVSYCVTVSVIVCETVTLPEVAVTTMLLVPAGVPEYLSLLPLQPVSPAANTTAKTTRAIAFHAARLRRRRQNKSSRLAELMPDIVVNTRGVWIAAWKLLFFEVVAITATTEAV